MMQTTTAKSAKVYVAVRADFAEDGTLLPRVITWEDGEKFAIDKNQFGITDFQHFNSIIIAAPLGKLSCSFSQI